MEENKSNEEFNKENLPVLKDKSSLLEKTKRNIPKIFDGLKKAGATIAYGTIGATLGAVALMNGPVIATAAGIGSVAFFVKSGKTAINKKSPSLMFSTNKVASLFSKEEQIHQDGGITDSVRLSSYNRSEKGALMALQLLVGFSRMKDELNGSSYTIEDGQKIYTRRYSTVTHERNIENLEKLQELGYIKIDNIESEFSRYPLQKPKKQQTLLIAEKLGFGNFEDLRKILKAKFTNNEEKLESMKKTFEKLHFRLTDKSIDIEELFAKFNGFTECKDEEKTAMESFSSILDQKKGLLATKEIDIKKDRFGRMLIDYSPKKSFIQRMQEKFRIGGHPEIEFEERLKKGVDVSKVNEVGKEFKTNSQSDKTILIDDEIKGRD